MAVPWLRILDAAVGFTDLARRASRRSLPESESRSMPARLASRVEAHLAGVVVAALKETFDRDAQRLALEREQIEAEQQRAERALRLELARQAGDRETSRLRLLVGVAAGSLLATLLFSSTLAGRGGPGAGAALGTACLLLIGALASAFTAQRRVGRALDRIAEAATSGGATRGSAYLEASNEAADSVSRASGSAGVAAAWLVIAGLVAAVIGVLIT